MRLAIALALCLAGCTESVIYSVPERTRFRHTWGARAPVCCFNAGSKCDYNSGEDVWTVVCP